MKFFRYIGNVISGRFAHWNQTNNQVIAEHWERAEEFPTPLAILFHDFIATSATLVDALLGPDAGRNRLINKDPLSLQRPQFSRIHAIILESLAGIFISAHPRFADSVKGGLGILTGRNPDNSDTMALIGGMDAIDLKEIGRLAWERIVEVADSSQGTDAITAFDFLYLFLGLTSTSMQAVTEKLSKLPVAVKDTN